jgi:hypothetical protein
MAGHAACVRKINYTNLSENYMERDHLEGLSEYWRTILINTMTFKMVVKEQG